MRWLTCLFFLILAHQVQVIDAQAPPAQWVEHLAFNTTSPPLDNATLRQAIASAIDRQAVYDAVKGKFPVARGWRAAGPAGSWFPPILPQHGPDVRIHPYNVAAAKTLLAQAGFPDGQGLPEFELLYRQDDPWNEIRGTEAAIIRAQLAAVGIKIKTVGIARSSDFFNRVVPGAGKQSQYQMAVFAWGIPNPEKGKDDFLRQAFLQGGPQNAYGYRNPDVTLLIADILKEADPAKRLAMLRDAEKLILTDAPVVPLLYFYIPP